MAGLQEILTGRYNRALQKLLSMKGQASVTDLAPEIAATFPLFWGAENRYLEGWERFGAVAAQAAVVGSSSAVQLRNPVVSGVVGVIEKLAVESQTAGALINVTVITSPPLAVDLAVANLAGAFDSRGRLRSSCLNSSGTNPPILGSLIAQYFAQNTGTIDVLTNDLQEIPLLPGSTVLISTQAVNTQLTGTFWWRERPLEDSEKT